MFPYSNFLTFHTVALPLLFKIHESTSLNIVEMQTLWIPPGKPLVLTLSATVDTQRAVSCGDIIKLLCSKPLIGHSLYAQ